MQFLVTAVSLAGAGTQLQLFNIPGECPRCHRAVHPQSVSHAMLTGRDVVQSIFRCTHPNCQELFIATYKAGGRGYELGGVAPQAIQPPTFPESITNLSPTFVEIYGQSMQAEASQFDQLVGIGLRKALEFLIKDYAVSERPNEADVIRKVMLAPCIEQYVGDTNVKECAKRAAWLGNDETHYTRRWESRDIEDLKRLVKLTVNWIDSAITTKRYLAEMEQGKPA